MSSYPVQRLARSGVEVHPDGSTGDRERARDHCGPFTDGRMEQDARCKVSDVQAVATLGIRAAEGHSGAPRRSTHRTNGSVQATIQLDVHMVHSRDRESSTVDDSLRTSAIPTLTELFAKAYWPCRITSRLTMLFPLARSPASTRFDGIGRPRVQWCFPMDHEHTGLITIDQCVIEIVRGCTGVGEAAPEDGALWPQPTDVPVVCVGSTSITSGVAGSTPAPDQMCSMRTSVVSTRLVGDMIMSTNGCVLPKDTPGMRVR